jgi:hypothetical protein
VPFRCLTCLSCLISNRLEKKPGHVVESKSFAELDYKTLLVEPAQGAHYFDFGSIKGMMSVMDLLEREFVSSMMTPCAILSRPICLKPDTISGPYRSCSDTAMSAPR